MKYLQFYIDGEWVDPVEPKTLDVINPATEEAFGAISLGSKADVDKAVAAARRAFKTYSETSVEERLELFNKIIQAYQKRYDDIAAAIRDEMGAPNKLASSAQAGSGLFHFTATMQALKDFKFEYKDGDTRIRREPIGVAGLITPWNWPINQVSCKVAPALAVGCTMILKPSEIAPFDACILAEVLHEAGVPKGVFNLINGDGPGVGEALSSHPDIDMMSFTGSTRAGRLVSKSAADTIKRVSLELGGKSANIILDDADLEKAVFGGVLHCMNNTGQSCNAPTRMLVPSSKQDDAIRIAQEAVKKIRPGIPTEEGTTMGPLSSAVQFEKVQSLIQKGIDEGAKLVVGGVGKPDGMNRGYFVKPTIFANVSNDMTIAREEIFGPVLSILPYETEEEAIEIANDTPYGLSNYIQSGDNDRAYKIASKLRSGMVQINGASLGSGAGFGGYKQSGNGREWGEHGLLEYLEIKSIAG